MPAWAEGLLLLASALVIAAAAADFLRAGLAQRRDRQFLDRLAERSRAEAPGGEGDAPRDPVGERTALERKLRAAGLPIGPMTFVAAVLLGGVVAFSALLAALPDLPIAAFAAGGLAVYLSWAGLGSIGRLRARRFEARLGEALGFMVGSLQAGENPTQAFASVAEASSGAIRREFSEVAHRLELGMPIRRALARITEGYDAEGVRLFAQSLIAKWEVGGDLAPLLESVGRIVRDRIQVRLRLLSQLGGARVTAAAVAVLPYAVIPIFLWKLPSMIHRLLDHPLGPSLLVVAVLLQVVAWMWLGRILRIEL